MSRVKIGFHRLGAVIAVPLALAGVGLLFVSVSTASSDPSTTRFFGGLLILGAMVFYGLARGIGWVVDGFVYGDAVSQPEVFVKPTPSPVQPHALSSDGSLTLEETAELNAIKLRVGGLLLLTSLGTLVAPFLLLKNLYDLFSIAFRYPFASAGIINFIYLEIIFASALFITSVFTLILLHRQSILYPKFFAGLLLGLALFSIVDYTVARNVFDAKAESEDIQNLGRSIGACVIWVPYMLLSKRVRRTFVN